MPFHRYLTAPKIAGDPRVSTFWIISPSTHEMLPLMGGDFIFHRARMLRPEQPTKPAWPLDCR